MITREEYLKALEIIDYYHRQNERNPRELKENDIIIFSVTHSKHVTRGKDYQVIQLDDLGYRKIMWIKNDKRQSVNINMNSHLYQWEIKAE